MVVIDDNKCKGCGDCIKICHESCMYLEKDKIKIDYEYCSACSQCIAICSKQALSWNGNPPVKFSKVKFPTEEQINELFGQRRTIRHFQIDKPSKELVEEIVNYGMLAPSHHHDFRIILVDDKRILGSIDDAVFRYNKRIYKYLYKPKIVRYLIKLISSPNIEKEFIRAKPKLENSLKLGKAYSNMPPIIILIVGDRNLPLSTESAQYILYNIILYGMTRGVGSRLLVGNQWFLNKNHKLKKLLGIEKKERIYGTLGIGYTAVKFRNKVTGRNFPVEWNGIKNNRILV